MMKCFPAGLALALVILLSGCGDSRPKLVARWQFAGADGLRVQTGAPALHALLSHSNSPALGARLLTNATVAAARWLSDGKPAADAIALAQPLVEDLLGRESAGEVWRHRDGSVEVAVAVRVTAERATLWADNFPKWTRPLGKGIAGAWVSADRGWLFAVSRGDSERASAFRKRVLAVIPSPARLLEIETEPGAWPGVSATATASNGAVRWAGTFRRPGLGELPLKDWQYPTNAIHDPLIAFTAARGVTPALAKALGFEQYLAGQEVGQFYHWAQPDSPFQSYAVVHLSDPGKVISKVRDELSPLYSTNGSPGSRFGLVMYDAEKQILALASAPGAMPMLTGATNLGPGFLGFSLFRMKRSANPPPRELLGELLKPGLVFYEWEVTSENAIHWAANLQVKDISAGLRPPSGDGLAQTWLLAASSAVENTVTEVRQTGPGEFGFTRKAPGGLSAFELVALSRWLEPPTERPARATSGKPAPMPALPPALPAAPVKTP